MVIIKIIGGLGNQLFQYAIGRSIEIKLGYKVKFDISDFENYKLRNFELNKLNTKVEFSTNIENIALRNIISKSVYKFHRFLPKLIGINKLKYYLEEDFHFVNNLFEISDSTYLSGYWQSDKYFREIRSTLIQELGFRNQPSGENLSYLLKIQSSNSVSIHIRRGDYVLDASASNIHGFCGIDYYNNSISIIESQIQDPIFFVFSDDILWAKNNIKSNFNIYFIGINNDRPEEDFRLMTKCKHNIIANSSFSWWAAWLNENKHKIVISPKSWFTSFGRSTIDLIPEEWQKV